MIDRFGLIVGAMKCGTTALFYTLALHPEICASSDKEPIYFSDAEDFSRGEDKYLTNWDWDPTCHAVALEAATHNTKSDGESDVVDRMVQFASKNRALRFVYLVRDPVDRLAAEYKQSLIAGWMDVSINEFIYPHAFKISRYAMQLDLYAARFGMEAILVIEQEDLKNNREEVLRRILVHLGIDETIEISNIGRVHDSEAYVDRLLHKAALKAGLEVEPAGRQEVGAFLKEHYGSKGADIVTSVRHLYNPEPATRRKIRDLLADDMHRFAAQWGVDIGAWGF